MVDFSLNLVLFNKEKEEIKEYLITNFSKLNDLFYAIVDNEKSIAFEDSLSEEESIFFKLEDDEDDNSTSTKLIPINDFLRIWRTTFKYRKIKKRYENLFTQQLKDENNLFESIQYYTILQLETQAIELISEANRNLAEFVKIRFTLE
jgi:hypothetical protein